jgi:hypothetical protein
MHPDLITADLEAEAERLAGLGASRKADVDRAACAGPPCWTQKATNST